MSESPEWGGWGNAREAKVTIIRINSQFRPTSVVTSFDLRTNKDEAKPTEQRDFGTSVAPEASAPLPISQQIRWCNGREASPLVDQDS
jgi:hypothetical protein